MIFPFPLTNISVSNTLDLSWSSMQLEILDVCFLCDYIIRSAKLSRVAAAKLPLHITTGMEQTRYGSFCTVFLVSYSVFSLINIK